MGTFEKLGILVIVVIIVMIMAVAIYQWGGPESQLDFGPFTSVSPAGAAEQDPPLEVDYLPATGAEPAPGRTAVPDTLRIPNGRRPVAHTPVSGRRGVPKVYVVKSGDILWKIVVQQWGLSERFLIEVQQANPKVHLDKVTPGMRVQIPDPSAYFRDATPAARTSYRTYRVQEGDDLWHISRKHLGRAARYKEIVRLNPGISPKKLRAGQMLRLPAK